MKEKSGTAMPLLSQKSSAIVSTLRENILSKVAVYDRTFEVFSNLKEFLHDLVNTINPHLQEEDRRIRLEYRDKGKFEAEVRVAGDILLISMHTNVFLRPLESIPESHSLLRQHYPQEAFFGVIHFYNFLADSFKLNRKEDLGYLVARLFVNRQGYFYVEGQNQQEFAFDRFGHSTIAKEHLLAILENAIQYVLDFHLYVPPFDVVKVATVGQMNVKAESPKLQTGKRIGYPYFLD